MTIHADNMYPTVGKAPMLAGSKVHEPRTDLPCVLNEATKVLEAFNGFIASISDLAEIEAFGVQDVWDPALDAWIKATEAMRSEVVNRAKEMMLIAGCELSAAWLTKVCAEFVRLMNSSDVHEYSELVQDLRNRLWRQDSRSLPRAQMIALDAFSVAFENLLQCPDYCVDAAAPEPVQRFVQAA